MEKYQLLTSVDQGRYPKTRIIPNNDIYISDQHLDILSQVDPNNINKKLASKDKPVPNTYLDKENYNILSQDGNCWIDSGMYVETYRNNLRIEDNALVTNKNNMKAWICKLSGNIIIKDNALIYQSAIEIAARRSNIYILDNACLINSYIKTSPFLNADIIISGYAAIINTKINIYSEQHKRNDIRKTIYIMNSAIGEFSNLDTQKQQEIDFIPDDDSNNQRYYLYTDIPYSKKCREILY
jgi:hypothetical protein